MSFIGDKARVVSILGPDDGAQYMVEVHGELWKANSNDNLKLNDVVYIRDLEGLILVVQK